MTMAKPGPRVRKHSHIDSMVRRRMENLFEALNEFERITSRRATVIVVPHRHDEPMTVWEAGRRVVGVDPVESARAAVQARELSAHRE